MYDTPFLELISISHCWKEIQDVIQKYPTINTITDSMMDEFIQLFTNILHEIEKTYSDAYEFYKKELNDDANANADKANPRMRKICKSISIIKTLSEKERYIKTLERVYTPTLYNSLLYKVYTSVPFLENLICMRKVGSSVIVFYFDPIVLDLIKTAIPNEFDRIKEVASRLCCRSNIKKICKKELEKQKEKEEQKAKTPAHIMNSHIELAILKNQTCPISLETMSAETIGYTPCGHLFYYESLHHTFTHTQLNGCPTCRKPMKITDIKKFI